PTATVELVVQLRQQLSSRGLDAGADTIAWHLHHHHHLELSRATIHRILTRASLVTPEPKKRPKSSYIRFEAEQPNETWQSDFTHYRLANGRDVE
ncbi:TPA: IS481 family transposase, partial [Burkholderia cenocepacia]